MYFFVNSWITFINGAFFEPFPSRSYIHGKLNAEGYLTKDDQWEQQKVLSSAYILLFESMVRKWSRQQQSASMELDLENDDGSDDLNSVGSDSELEELTKEDSPSEKQKCDSDKNEELEEVLDNSEMTSANKDREKEGSRQTKASKKLEFVKVSKLSEIRILSFYYKSHLEKLQCKKSCK